MPNLMQTGIEGLDRILHGGFQYHNSIVLKGAPGCGKTTLGMQIIHNGVAQFDEPGIIVLFEQFPQQLYRDVEAYGWNIRELEEQGRLRVIFTEPEQLFTSDKVADPPLVAAIHDATLETGARRILVDSVSHILQATSDGRESRDLLLRFINRLKSIGLTPIMTAEAESREGAIGVEEYLADCVLLLASEGSAGRSFPLRQIAVRKTRGQDHLRGRHVFRITEKGVEVYPRTIAERGNGARPGEEKKGLTRVSSGVSGLDSILGGGYTRGTSTIVAGMPGAVKTTLGMQFAIGGGEVGERGLVVTFGESPEFLSRVMEEKGLRIRDRLGDGTLRIWPVAPGGMPMEELLFRLEKEMAAGSVSRLFVDSLNDIERSIENPTHYKDIISAFPALCERHGVTALFTQKMDEFSGNVPLASIRYASIFDGIIYLGTIEIESAVHKVISVLKMRGGDYSSDLREITCGAKGLEVRDKFVGLSGVLSGNAQGQYKKTVEELFQPLYFVRDFIDILAQTEMEAEQRSQILGNLQSEANRLVQKLEAHFDIRSAGEGKKTS